MVKCKSCGTNNIPSARYCMECGNLLVLLDSETQQTTGYRICSNCGQKIEPNKVFCKICGTKNSYRDYIIYTTMRDIDNLSGEKFEQLLATLFVRMGYGVRITPTSGDQGADLILESSSNKIVVQAKRYSNKVTNKAIQEVVASISYYNANEGMVVTNSEFTSSAIKLANANNIKLISRNQLSEWVNTYM